MSNTKWLLLMPLAAIAGAVGAPNLSDANDDDVVIGFATSRSGFMAQYDDNPTKMAQVFIDEANAKGGLLGRKLRAVFADAKSDRVEGVRAAQTVVRQGPDLVFGSCDYDWGSPAVFEAQKAGKISVYICAEIRRRASQDLMLSPLLPSPRPKASPWPIGRLTKRAFVRRTCSWTTPASTTNRFAAALIGSFP